MEHPAVGQKVTFERDGAEHTGKIDKAKAGPMMADGKSKVGSVKVMATAMLRIVPDDGSAPFWAGPFKHEPAQAPND